jgi:hypothetical protein
VLVLMLMAVGLIAVNGWPQPLLQMPRFMASGPLAAEGSSFALDQLIEYQAGASCLVGAMALYLGAKMLYRGGRQVSAPKQIGFLIYFMLSLFLLKGCQGEEVFQIGMGNHAHAGFGAGLGLLAPLSASACPEQADRCSKTNAGLESLKKLNIRSEFRLLMVQSWITGGEVEQACLSWIKIQARYMW